MGGRYRGSSQESGCLSRVYGTPGGQSTYSGYPVGGEQTETILEVGETTECATGENVRFPEETGKTRVFIHRRKENAAVSPDSHLSLGEPIGPFLPRRPQREALRRGELLLTVVGRSRKVGAAAGNPWEGRHIKQQMGTMMEERA